MKNLKKRVLNACVATFALAFSLGLSSCDLSAFLPTGGNQGDGTVKAEFTYKLEGDSYVIVGRGTDDSGILNLPSTYNGKPVTEIADGAFSGDIELGKVVIPDSITTIGEGAFYNCVNLQSAEIGDGVTDLPKKAFMNCIFLNSLTLPSGLVNIGESAFQSCSKLKDVELPSTVQVIENKAFYECKWLEEVNFSSVLAKIGDQAFANCASLKEVVIPDGAPTRIGKEAFTIVDDTSGDLRMKIERIEFGDSVISVGERAFASNGRVRRLVLGDSMQTLGARAFYSCRRLFSVVVGANVPTCETAVVDGTTYTPFTSCNIVREVIDGSGTLIKGSAGLGGLLEDVWSVKTPDQESSISYDEESKLVYYMGGDPYTNNPNGAVVISAFVDELDEAQDVVIPDTYLGKPVTSIGDRAFYNDNGVKSLDTGDNCQYIGESAFRNAYAIMTLTLGKSMKTIREYAFLNTTALTKVYFYCGTNLTDVGVKAFKKKDGVSADYANIYFAGTETDWNTVKSVIVGGGQNDELFVANVSYIENRE